MPDRILEDILDRMLDRISEDMLDRMEKKNIINKMPKDTK